MPRYVALLRAVNVGGTGKLPMTELKAMCVDEGFADAQTYIASGNVVFSSKLGAAKVKAALERRLQAYAGKPVGIVIRSADEIAAVLRANPFPKAPPNYTVAIFLDEPPPKDALKDIKGQQDEEVRLGKREIYVAYGSGMGRSKLKIPAAAKGTARNINTIAKLAELAAGDNEG
ncbi:uncharacterized protein (DUF1697 family) [Bradyrhizobium sp. USDA 4524]|uniref:DUF1697 domain-containing protein n=1 Tax=Bradyrhizobium TaxID=374 RepID=UPI0020A0FDF2|nr:MULTISPECIES: DUF1697 domain-containing protein [Bradyrhizobium]MCP1840759.1 uncharacterized protein (DUF1697 family) [Bradyrhizobium sp. USDA 4538]MCP1901323.1 uncharacterized protein (DUF1697 family) [Bradyrhizobium sp. USDA 4537]MCP1993021.1 uncharacterized protein (DUF1697 family) [Bradyrhizobium sp. USDA 4539]MCP3417759.1 DUF1697 domain-containing protein [Bradyrhizobium brasilense]